MHTLVQTRVFSRWSEKAVLGADSPQEVSTLDLPLTLRAAHDTVTHTVIRLTLV